MKVEGHVAVVLFLLIGFVFVSLGASFADLIAASPNFLGRIDFYASLGLLVIGIVSTGVGLLLHGKLNSNKTRRLRQT